MIHFLTKNFLTRLLCCYRRPAGWTERVGPKPHIHAVWAKHMLVRAYYGFSNLSNNQEINTTHQILVRHLVTSLSTCDSEVNEFQHWRVNLPFLDISGKKSEESWKGKSRKQRPFCSPSACVMPYDPQSTCVTILLIVHALPYRWLTKIQR